MPGVRAGGNTPSTPGSSPPRRTPAKSGVAGGAGDADLFDMQIEDAYYPAEDQPQQQQEHVPSPDQAAQQGGEEAPADPDQPPLDDDDMPSEAQLREMAEVEGLPIEQCASPLCIMMHGILPRYIFGFWHARCLCMYLCSMYATAAIPAA